MHWVVKRNTPLKQIMVELQQLKVFRSLFGDIMDFNPSEHGCDFSPFFLKSVDIFPSLVKENNEIIR